MPGPLIRSRDISGIRYPENAQPLSNQSTGQAVPVSRPPEIEPGPNAHEFLLSWSVLVAGNSTAQLFTLDGSGNVTAGAAYRLPDNTRARLSGVVVEGESPLGTPVLQFSIRIDPNGGQRLPGWEAVNLPGRGGVSSLAIEPFTIIPPATFFGGFVQNLDGAQHYAAITIQGWTI